MMKKSLENKKIIMIMAFRNFQDEEFFIPKQVLEDSGANIKTASSKKGVAVGFDGGTVEIDFLVSEININSFDAIIFVGGLGCLKCLDNEISYFLIKESIKQNKVLGAICIAPVILANSGVLLEKKATVWSKNNKSTIKFLKEKGANYLESQVVIDKKIITANGPWAAKEFGEAIVSVLGNNTFPNKSLRTAF